MTDRKTSQEERSNDAIDARITKLEQGLAIKESEVRVLRQEMESISRDREAWRQKSHRQESRIAALEADVFRWKLVAFVGSFGGLLVGRKLR